MELSKPINIRLPIGLRKRYEMEAALMGVPFRTYIRNRLEESDEIQNQSQGTGDASDSQTSNINSTAILEMLLLLRQIAQPQRVNLAQQELKRLGYNIWGINDESR